MSSLVEGLGASMQSLAEQAQLRELVFLACADSGADVRQSGFALMGDLAKTCPSHLQPVLRRSLESCCAMLQQDNEELQRCIQAANNACWAIGELALRAPAAELEPCMLGLVQSVAGVLSRRLEVSKGMLENAGIALGRLAMRCPQPLAPHLQSFVQPWCLALRRVRDGEEKEQGYTGLCTLVQLNPMAAMPAFVPLANAFASWRKLDNPALHRQMAEILRGYQARARASAPRRARSLAPAACALTRARPPRARAGAPARARVGRRVCQTAACGAGEAARVVLVMRHTARSALTPAACPPALRARAPSPLARAQLRRGPLGCAAAAPPRPRPQAPRW